MGDVAVGHQKTVLAFLMVVSLFGVLLSSSFVFFPAGFEDDFAFRNLVVGSAFIAICVLGLLVAVFPGSCSSFPRFWRSNRREGTVLSMHQESFRAHHPSCEGFSAHIFRVGKLEVCATCSGLAVGASVVLVGAVLYFFGAFSAGASSLLVLLGAVGVVLGLVQSALPKFSNGAIRFFASVFFVAGAFLMLVGVDGALGSTVVDLFVVALSLLWIMTKIAFSRWDHQRTCSLCSTSCEWKNLR